jgi:hypothetical protein
LEVQPSQDETAGGVRLNQLTNGLHVWLESGRPGAWSTESSDV